MKTGLTGPPAVEWAVALRALPGESESGDAYVVRSSDAGTLVAVVDGLGHGREAAVAARAAVSVLEACTPVPITDVIKHCHEVLAKTRGAAMSVALFSSRECTMTWLGVGNVQGVLIPGDCNGTRRHEHLLLRGGVVGFRLPSLHPSKLGIVPGDTLVLATDGIASDFAQDVLTYDPPERITDGILNRYRRGGDDALVLVARYLGWGQ